MTNVAELTVAISCVEEGRWLATTNASPYFCVEAASEAAVKRLAADALRFYEAALVKHGGNLPAPAPKHLTIKERVSARELVAA